MEGKREKRKRTLLFDPSTIEVEHDDADEEFVLKKPQKIRTKKPTNTSSPPSSSPHSADATPFEYTEEETEMGNLDKTEKENTSDDSDQEDEVEDEDEVEEDFSKIPDDGKLVLIKPGEIIVRDSLFKEIFVFSIGPAIQAKMTRKKQNLPKRFGFFIHQKLHELAFGTLQDVNLTTGEEIKELLGEHAKKTYKGGSYALIKPPLKITYTAPKTTITFRYAVFNKRGRLQWPKNWS